MKILITGGAGFIGFHVAKALISRGDEVVAVDNFNDYYDVSLKEARAKELKELGIDIIRADISDKETMAIIFKKHSIDKVCHLAAQAGVRYSLENPFAYEQSNILGMLVLLELARHHNIKDFIFASSSSVYGNNKKVPFSEEDNVDCPISLYAATKKSTELMAHVYHHLFGLNCIGLRFFTVYGPFGRPDMAYFKFTKKILAGEPIEVYGHGNQERDFTYIDDIVSGVLSAIDNIENFGYEIFNLGGDNPVNLMYFISCIEQSLGIEADKKMVDMQPGDVRITMADLTKSREKLGFDPKTKIEEGIKAFIKWYKEFYNQN